MVKDQYGDEWEGASWGEVPTIIENLKVSFTFNMSKITEDGEPDSYFYLLLEEFDENDDSKGQCFELELTIEDATKIFEGMAKALQVDVNALKTQNAKAQLGDLISQLQKVHNEMEA